MCHPERSKHRKAVLAQSNFCGSSEASKQKCKKRGNAPFRSRIH